MRIKTSLLLLLLCGEMTSQAQLNQNPNKFLGNITTMYQVRSDFDKYWDQLTPENETKWGSIEGTRDVYNWTTVDEQYKYCKDHGFKFKFHTLVWGGQYPSWMNNLSKEEQLEEIVEWFDAVAERYPDLEYIDVVNEALPGHAPAPYKAALGGDGASGYDWIVKAFQMARDRWPKAVLIYNDYNTFQWNTDQYIDLLQRIIKAGAPVDAAGCQSHDLNDLSGDKFKVVLEKIHNEVGIPIFISEYDIDLANDDDQLKQYQEQIPIMWEADYVAGVTLWGYIYGATWVDHSGLIKEGVERPALKWLREYMQTDAAKNAKSPLIKPASDYAYMTATPDVALIGDKTTIVGKASSADSTIAEIRLYCDNSLVAKFDTSAFNYEWSPLEVGNYNFKMQVLTSVSTTLFERSCTIKGCEPAKPFNGKPIVLPGKLEAEDFDEGENTIAYSDNDKGNNGTSNEYRPETDVDIDKNDGDGWVVGWTNAGEWIQYTVDVKEEHVMLWTARVSSGTSGSAFSIRMGETDLTGRINVPQTASSSWGTYTEIKGLTKVAMPVGIYNIRIQIEGSSCNLDYIIFEPSTGDEVLTGPYNGSPAPIPGTIEVEDYDKALKGFVAEAYKDNDSDNQGDANYRSSEGVDIVKGNGGKVIGYTNPGEWTLYTVNVEATQKYYWGAYVSSGTTGAAFRLYLDDVDITGKISIPQTGSNSWNTYKLITGETIVELPEGTHILKLLIEGANGNIDKVIFSTEEVTEPSTGITGELADNGVFDVFSVMGVYRGTVEINNRDTSVLNGKFESGIYILRNKATGEAIRVMVK